jgi:glutaredoxin
VGAGQGAGQEFLKSLCESELAVSQICPHCAYPRKDSDDVPDWQCPRCEKAYGKAVASPQPPESLRQYAHPVEASRGGGGKWLLFLFVLGGAFWFGRPLLKPHAVVLASTQTTSQPEVHLYATDWCGYCKATRQFFNVNGIRYVEHDIEKSSDALLMHRKLGGNGVPLVVIGDEVIRGYNEATMRELLRPWLKG